MAPLKMSVQKCQCGKFYDSQGHKLAWAVRVPTLAGTGYRRCAESPHAATLNGARALLVDCEQLQKEAALND